MSVQYYPNGIGGTAPGDQLDLARPLQTTGNVWYVNSAGGVDAASPAGQNREKPLATAAQAVTNAADDDIIVFLPSHAETLAATVVVNKRLTLVGEGTTSGKPAVRFTQNSVGPAFILSAIASELRNVYFPEAASALGASSKVSWTGARGRLIGCYFEQGANDNGGPGLSFSAADGLRIENCTFISTATLVSAQPFAAIRQGVGATVDVEITNTTISAGTVGYSNYAAIDLSSAACTRCKFTGLSLLLGADVNMGAAATGRVNVQLSTGGSRVAWG